MHRSCSARDLPKRLIAPKSVVACVANRGKELAGRGEDGGDRGNQKIFGGGIMVRWTKRAAVVGAIEAHRLSRQLI